MNTASDISFARAPKSRFSFPVDAEVAVMETVKVLLSEKLKADKSADRAAAELFIEQADDNRLGHMTSKLYPDLTDDDAVDTEAGRWSLANFLTPAARIAVVNQ